VTGKVDFPVTKAEEIKTLIESELNQVVNAQVRIKQPPANFDESNFGTYLTGCGDFEEMWHFR